MFLGAKGYPLIPTKTSRFRNQLTGSVPFLFRSFFHVSFINWVYFLSRLVWLALMRSVVSLSLITRSHRFWITCSFIASSCMTCLHLRTHTRWAASDMKIWRSRRIAFCFSEGGWWRSARLWGGRPSGRDRVPTPSTIPRFMFGHSSGAWGHMCCASSHTLLLDRALHPVSICPMLSSASHIAQCCLISYPGMCLHIGPTM